MARVVLLVVLGVAVGFAAGRFTAPETPHAARASGERDVTGEVPERARAPVAHAGDTGSDNAPASSASSSGSAPTPDAPLRADERRVIRALVRAGYDQRAPAAAPADSDLFDAAVDEVQRSIESYRESLARSLGGRLVDRQQRRDEFGEIADFPLVLQFRTPAWRAAKATLVTRGEAAELPFGLPPDNGPSVVYVHGGTIPPGRMLVIEEIRLRIASNVGGSAVLRKAGREVFEWRNNRADAPRTLELRLAGLQRVEHGDEDRVELYGSRAAAIAELRGKLVPREEGAKLTPRPFIMVGEGNGFLTNRAPILQVLADHGGGNARTVRLDGYTSRIDVLEPASIWTDEPNLRKQRQSIAHYENCGVIPPDKAYRITRVAYRVLLDKQAGKNSRFDIQIGKEKIEGNAAESDRFEDAWNGDVLLRPGEEQKVAVTCHYYGLAEVTVFGQLVDDK